MKKRISEATPEALDVLSRYSFPGNVRELANEIERAGREIGNEARSIDVDVDIRRRPPGNSS